MQYLRASKGVLMKYLIILLMLLVTSFEAISEPSVGQILESKKVLGRRKLLGNFSYIKANDKRNPTGKFEYYFSLTSDKGKGYAFPVIIQDKNIINKIRSGRGEQFLIYATAEKTRIWIGEVPKTLQVLKVSHANSISLGHLSHSDINISSSNNYQSEMRERGKNSSATISGINDTLTNTIIFGAGAALLGTLLLTK